MNNYALAKLISSVKEVDSRKRLQKCVFLLQAGGCDLGAEYFLHYYGPYSRDVAEATDDLAEAGILDEKAISHPRGERYEYSLSKKGESLLKEYEDESEGTEVARIVGYVKRFKQLNECNMWELELASTIAYYQKTKGLDWEEAKQKTAEFKQVEEGADVLDRVQKLAQEFVDKAA